MSFPFVTLTIAITHLMRRLAPPTRCLKVRAASGFTIGVSLSATRPTDAFRSLSPLTSLPHLGTPPSSSAACIYIPTRCIRVCFLFLLLNLRPCLSPHQPQIHLRVFSSHCCLPDLRCSLPAAGFANAASSASSPTRLESPMTRYFSPISSSVPPPPFDSW